MEKKYLPESIAGTRILLKKHHLDLAETMFDYVIEDKSRLMRFLPWAKFINKVQDEANYIKMTHEKWDRYELFDYGIFLREGSPTFIGNIGIHSIAWSHDRCELGYWILGRFEGQGYVLEAARMLLEQAFQHGFNRVEIHCDPNNNRSARIPQLLGFRLEATLKEHMKDHAGIYRDTSVYARLKAQGVPKALAPSLS